jgi:two-component system, NarL family, sensor histidine kinase UhpB
MAVRVPTVVRSLLRLPMFGKALAANVAIVLLGAVVGTYVTFSVARADPELHPVNLAILFAGLGVVLSLIVNYLLLRAALIPVRDLAAAVDTVSRGDFSARAPRSAVRDPQIDAFIDTFNRVLEDVQTYRLRVSELSSQIISAQEEERKRIARELHDETAQSLTSLLVRLKIAERGATPDEVRAGIAHAREVTVRALDEVRNLALDLRPSVLDDLGLVPALNWYTEHYERDRDVSVELATDVEAEPRLPPEIEVVAYRVVQEALTNVAKHSGASVVTVKVSRDADSLHVAVSDDGVGFDAAARNGTRDGRLGLFGMRERLALVGGSLVVDSKPGRGATVRARIPLPPLVSLEPTNNEREVDVAPGSAR